MNPSNETSRVGPLQAGLTDRLLLNIPRASSSALDAPRFVMGNRSFMRTWAARRAKAAQEAQASRVTSN